MITVAIINQKGGVAKTTTCINLSAQFSLKHRTLMVDCDKQANLSHNFEQKEPSSTIKDAFLGNDFKTVPVRENLELLPSSTELIGIEVEIQDKFRRESLLEKALAKVSDNFDFCFIDCPPDIGLVTVNALSCADYIIIPVKASQFSLQGIASMLTFVREIREEVNPNLTILGFVLTHFDERLNVSKKILEEIKKNGWDVALFKSTIRVNTAIENSQFENKTIFEYDMKSNGSKDYAALGKEVLTKIKNLENGR